MNQINTFWTKTYTPIKLFNPKNRSFLYYQVSMENSGTIKGILIFFAIVVSFLHSQDTILYFHTPLYQLSS